MDNFRVAAREYWTLRNAGELGEMRTRAHNVLLDEMTRCKIEYEDREDAAQTAHRMLEKRSNPTMTTASPKPTNPDPTTSPDPVAALFEDFFAAAPETQPQSE